MYTNEYCINNLNLHDILTMQATSGQWFSLSLKHFSNSINEVVSKMFQK